MTSHHTTEQIVTLLKCATEEHSVLQIDMQDFDDALNLCGSSPMCFNVTGDDAGVVLNACRDAAAHLGKTQVAAAVVVCGIANTSGNYTLAHLKEVFEVFRQAMDESAFLVFGASCDPSLKSSMRVTWLAGAPDR